MSEGRKILIGIDGGATRSHGVAIDSDGNVLGTSQAGSLNFFDASLGETRRSLNDLVQPLKTLLGAGNEFHRIVIGSAALFSDATREQTLAKFKTAPIPAYPCGGILEHNELVRNSFLQTLQKSIPIKLEPARLSPMLGAAIMALSNAGATLSEALIAQ